MKISARAEKWASACSVMAVSHFSPQFQITARAETSHVIATKFQPGGRAETRHVIGPLACLCNRRLSNLGRACGARIRKRERASYTPRASHVPLAPPAFFNTVRPTAQAPATQARLA